MRSTHSPGPRSALLVFAAAWLFASTIEAQPFAAVRFAKLYSTLDGYYQAIEVDIDTASGAPLQLGGRKLTFRDASGHVRTQILPARWDGPVKRGKLLLSNYTQSPWRDYIADIALERLILPVDGGHVELEGMDAWAFGPLPLDGRSALTRDGTIVPAMLDRYLELPAQGPLPILWDRAFVFAYEYRLAGTDHYLTTARASEIELLDRKAVPGWQRTGANPVGIWSRPEPDGPTVATGPVCRWMTFHDDGPSHVLSSDEHECALLSQATGGVLESPAAFHAYTPDKVTGTCPLPWVPVYRLWNGRASAAHRLTIDRSTRDAMVSNGWVSEGYGPDGVAFCSWWDPQS